MFEEKEDGYLRSFRRQREDPVACVKLEDETRKGAGLSGALKTLSIKREERGSLGRRCWPVEEPRG